MTKIATAIYMTFNSFKAADYILTGVFAALFCCVILLFACDNNNNIKIVARSVFIYVNLILLISFLFFLLFFDTGHRDIYDSMTYDFFRSNDITGSMLTMQVLYREYPEVNSFIAMYASSIVIMAVSLLGVTIWDKWGRKPINLLGIMMCSILILMSPALISMSFTFDNIEYSTSREKSDKIVDYINDIIPNERVLLPMRAYNVMLRTGRIDGIYAMDNEYRIDSCVRQCRSSVINYFLFDTHNRDFDESRVFQEYQLKEVGRIDRYILLKCTP